MKERIDNIPMPFIEGVDMREELKHGNRKILSRKLKRVNIYYIGKKTTIDYHAEQAWIFYFCNVSLLRLCYKMPTMRFASRLS